MDATKKRNSVFLIKYSLVWCTKDRYPVLMDGVDKTIEALFAKIATDNNFAIDELTVQPDHVRLIISATPNHPVAGIVKALKGVSARFVFQKHPDLKQKLYGGHLWHPSYYTGTIGVVSEEQIEKYLVSQKIRS